MQIQKIVLVTTILLIIPFWGKAAETDKKSFISKEQWSNYSRNYDFTETYKTKQQKNNTPKNSASPKLNKPLININSTVVKFIIYAAGIIIILLLLGLLIYNILKGVGEKVKNSSVNAISDNLENIENADLDSLLNNALNAGQFKEAIRTKYLLLLQTLNRLAFIKWKKDKTNGTYVNEMYGKSGFELFMKITIAFDRTWYGDKNISETDYYQLIPLFDQINTIIKDIE
jgi:hypothetical protein